MTGRRAAGAERVVLALLVAFRVALPLAVLAAAGGSLAGLPAYEYDPLAGDAYGYYSAMRELLATWQQHAAAVAPVLLASVLVAATCSILARRRRRPAVAVVGVAWAAGGLATALVLASSNTGAQTIGWPLVWSVPLLPYRSLGLPLDPDVAFGVALALSLVCSCAIVLGTFALGTRVTRSRGLGLFSATLIGLWPLVILAFAGTGKRAIGSWQVDLGLSAYSEPLSTALVVIALAIVVGRLDETRAALAGALLGFSVAVRLSNVLILACVLAWLFLRGNRSVALWSAGAAAAFAPVVLGYWPKGYASLSPPVFPEHPFALDYARSAWTGSELWRPPILLALLPLAILGTLRIAKPIAALLWSCILATAVLYTFYEPTPFHPRFLFVVLPLVLILWAAGAAEVVAAARRLARGGSRHPAPE